MKILIASIFVLSLMGATAANADVGVGAHIGGLGAGVHLGIDDEHHYHHRHCSTWGWHHRSHYCRRWY